MRARRAWLAATLGAAIVVGALVGAAGARASTTQVSIVEDDVHMLSDPAGTLSTFRALGARMVRVIVPWARVAPNPTARAAPSRFDATDPADYSAAAWAPYDRIVRLAQADGLEVDLTLSGGAPRWAEGPGIPAAAVRHNRYWAWRPSARDFGQFVRAVGERYSGHYLPAGEASPLPRVSFWAIWNEPNFGEDLGPQAVDGSTVPTGPVMYRNLVGRAWSALQATGHGRDTILIGELAPRGMSGPATPGHPQGLPGDFAQTRPLQFIRTLYCVDSQYRALRGAAARAVGCPTSAAGSRQFRAHNPALFGASGFADHPYPQNQPPTIELSRNRDLAPLPRLPNLERELDRLQRLYGSRRRLPIWDTEYGYITHPSNKGAYVSPARAAYYINWAEYLTWKQPRVASTMQYLLFDPPLYPVVPGNGGFTSGLLWASGRPKPAYASYRLPLYLPVTSARRGRALQVWGCVRPARYAILDTGQPQTAQIQFAPGRSNSFRTVRTVTVTNPDDCYFDVRVKLGRSGVLRLAYTYPGSSSVSAAADGAAVAGTTVNSRTVQVRLH